MKVKDLRDLPQLQARLTILSPVPTLRGPAEIDDDDEVSIRLAIGSAAFNLDITVDQYRRIAESLQPRATRSVPAAVELGDDDGENDDG